MEKCPSYRGVRLTIVRLIEVFYEKHTYVLPGQVEVSVSERCPSYGMSVLRGFTVVLALNTFSETAQMIFLIWDHNISNGYGPRCNN